MFDIFSGIFRSRINKLFIFVFYTYTLIYGNLYSKENKPKSYNNLEISNNYINWEKIKNNGKAEKNNIIWEKYDKFESNNTNDLELNDRKNEIELKQVEFDVSTKKTISSLNRSIVFDDKKIGPDISFLVPMVLNLLIRIL